MQKKLTKLENNSKTTSNIPNKRQKTRWTKNKQQLEKKLGNIKQKHKLRKQTTTQLDNNSRRVIHQIEVKKVGTNQKKQTSINKCRIWPNWLCVWFVFNILKLYDLILGDFDFLHGLLCWFLCLFFSKMAHLVSGLVVASIKLRCCPTMPYPKRSFTHRKEMSWIWKQGPNDGGTCLQIRWALLNIALPVL